MWYRFGWVFGCGWFWVLVLWFGVWGLGFVILRFEVGVFCRFVGLV